MIQSERKCSSRTMQAFPSNTSMSFFETESRFLRALYASLPWFCVQLEFYAYYTHEFECVNTTLPLPALPNLAWMCNDVPNELHLRVTLYYFAHWSPVKTQLWLPHFAQPASIASDWPLVRTLACLAKILPRSCHNQANILFHFQARSCHYLLRSCNEKVEMCNRHSS